MLLEGFSRILPLSGLFTYSGHVVLNYKVFCVAFDQAFNFYMQKIFLFLFSFLNLYISKIIHEQLLRKIFREHLYRLLIRIFPEYFLYIFDNFFSRDYYSGELLEIISDRPFTPTFPEHLLFS